jgi:hypothetical protein
MANRRAGGRFVLSRSFNILTPPSTSCAIAGSGHSATPPLCPRIDHLTTVLTSTLTRSHPSPSSTSSPTPLPPPECTPLPHQTRPQLCLHHQSIQHLLPLYPPTHPTCPASSVLRCSP